MGHLLPCDRPSHSLDGLLTEECFSKNSDKLDDSYQLVSH